jgi:hypothetical protein
MSDAENQARLQEMQRGVEMLEAFFGSVPNLDPRWEWIDIASMDGRPEYVKGACRHLTPTEVRGTVTGELLAYLCPDCDAQLPA